jgi:hypothetical protein
MNLLKKLTAVFCGAALVFSISAPALSGVAVTAATGQSVTLRVEGAKSTIYSGSVTPTQDEDAYDLLASALAAKNIPIVASVSAYGHFITAIGGETGSGNNYWHFYVNGKSSEVGADSVKPSAGDALVFYLGDDSNVLFPTVTVTPQNPTAGQQATINVSASYTDYTDPNNPVAKTAKISGVTLTLAGKKYATDADGNATVTMPLAGNYDLTAVKETKDTTQAIVRTGEIPLTVAAESGGGTGSGTTGGTTATGTSASIKGTVSTGAIKAAIAGGAAFIQKKGVIDWSTSTAYAAAGRKVPQSSYFAIVKQDIAAGATPVHLAGVVLGVRAAGGNPLNFYGKNLIAQLYNAKSIGKSGLNGYTYGLLALDCGGYNLPKTAQNSRQSLVNAILTFQKSGGAFSLSKTTGADSDMTAIAVTALSPYLAQPKVKSAVNKAVTYLSKAEQRDGGFKPAYTTSEVSETTAQVVIALSSVKIDAQKDKRFIKNGVSPINALFKYQQKDGGFAHIASASSDTMATAQTVTALAAYNKYKTSGGRIYKFAA